MASSQGKEGSGHDTANGRSRRGRLWLLAGMIVLALLVALAFVGYRQPDLLLEFANLRYCG